MFACSIDPNNDTDFYAASDMSELFHSTNGGATYSLASFLQVNGGHHATVRYTNIPGLLYTINYKMNGVLDQIVPAKSTDGGATWTMLAGTPDPSEETMTIDVDYIHPERVIVSTYGSIAMSRDFGATFTTIHTAADNGAGNVVGGVFFDGDRILVGTNDGLLISLDGGRTFDVQPTSGIPTGEKIWSFAAGRKGSTVRCVCITAASGVYVGRNPWEYSGFATNVYTMDEDGANAWVKRTAFASGEWPMYCAMAWNDASIIYLGGAANAAPMIKKSADGGQTWTNVFRASNNANIATGWSGSGGDRGWSFGETVFTLAVAPNNANVVMFGDYGFLHRTTDAGASWNQAYTQPVTPHSAGMATPTRQYYSSIGLENTSCWNLCFATAQTIIGCYTDIKGTISTDGGKHWGFDYAGHNANTMYRCVRAPNALLYAATSNIHDLYQSTRLADAQLNASDPQGKVIMSTDGGHTWTDVHAFGHPVFWIALDPGNERRAYASVVHATLGGVYVTSDLDKGSASMWTKLPSPPRTEGHPASIVVLKNGKVLCTYSGRRVTGAPTFTQSSGCFVYDPATSAWTDVSHPDMQWWSKDVVVDPSDPTERTWYVGVFSGWGGPANNKGGLFRTTDAGASWTKIFVSDRVTSCTFHPSNTNIMYATTEVEGLWYTTTARSATPTWIRDTTFPFRQPERVVFNPFDASEMWVTTAGNGLRRGKLGAETDVITPRAPLPFEVTIAPQPTSSVCTITINDPATLPTSIVVTTLDGTEVMRSASQRIDCAHLLPGTYAVRIYLHENCIAQRMIVVAR